MKADPPNITFFGGSARIFDVKMVFEMGAVGMS